MHQMFLEVPETLRNILDYLGGVDTPVGRVLVPRNLANLSKYIGSGEVNISASIKAPCTNFFGSPETNRDILDHLGDVDTPMGRALAPRKPGHVEQIHGGGGGQYLSFY